MPASANCSLSLRRNPLGSWTYCNSCVSWFSANISKGQTPPPGCGNRRQCSPAQSAAVTVIPGVVFSGSLDGHLRAYSAVDGKIIWDYDTAREFKTVNGVPGHGGAMDVGGPIVAGGILFASSGYARRSLMPGNVLIAFGVVP